MKRPATPETALYRAKAAEEFRSRLPGWFAASRRSFPWRTTDNAFHVLVAEFMLRRTQAIQVVPVYLRAAARFPDPASLAAASEADVADLLRPLGLAWRVPAFRQLAAALVERHGGAVPSDRGALLALPGVGDYVASAVRAVAFKEHDPIYDTNTVRVAGRYFGFDTHAESRRRRPVREAVNALFDPAEPRRSTLGILDFASLICRAGRPRCEVCPMAPDCCFARDRALAAGTDAVHGARH